jgi:hypothetical protein
MFHPEKEAFTMTASLEIALRRRCNALWDGIDIAVNVTEDGAQGYIFKSGNYYRYSLGTGPTATDYSSLHFTKIEGPFPTEKDFPGLWFTNVTAAFTGVENQIFLFQKTGSYDKEYQYHPPQYMIYDLGSKKIQPGYPKNIAEDWPGLFPKEFNFTGADQAMADALLLRANCLYVNIRLENDYFGNTSTYVVLETDSYFDKKKKEALKYLKSAQAEYLPYQTAMNVSSEKTAGLQLAVSVESTRYDALEKETKEALASSNDAFAKVDRLRGLLEAKGNALAEDTDELQRDVFRDWGVSWQDMFGCLTQLSFMHWLNVPKEPETGAPLMAVGQAGDLLLKGINNVVSDSGQSMSKAYVVRRVDTLKKEIRSFKDLTVTRSQFIDPNNLYNDAYKLTLTRDQFRELCNEFTGKFPAAQRIIDDLDEYVTLADQRNAAVLEYNRLWQRVYDLQSETVKCKLDFQHAQSSLAGHAQPHLPVFASFATERYNRAKDQTLNIFYLASRAYIMKSLRVRNMFSEMLRTLPQTGQIDAAAFTQESLQNLYDEVMDNLKLSSPPGPATAAIIFRQNTHPDVFESLAREGIATFSVEKATSKTTKGPFAYMANVRLTKVRCWAGGLQTGEKHHFRLVHSGREIFVSSKGEQLTVDHEPSTLSYAYSSNATIDPTSEGFEFHGTEEPKPLVGTKFALLGPFTTWHVLIAKKTDWAKATSLRVEFDVVSEGFEAHLGPLT